MTPFGRKTARPASSDAVAVWLVVAVAAAFVAGYIFVDLNKLCALRIGSNTGEYLQATLRFLHDGSTFNYVDHKSTLATHDQWMFLAIVPFALVWPHPGSVIVLQVLALAAAAPVLFALVKGWGGSNETAAIVAMIYLLAPSVQGYANAEFVPLDFVPLLASLLMLGLARGSLVLVLVCAELLCGTKEDVALFLVWFGVLLAVLRRPRLGVAIGALAAANLVVYFGLAHQFHFGTVHPAYTLRDDAWPRQVAFLGEILAPFLFAPLLFGWRMLFAVPLIAELFFAQWAYPLFQAGSYYTIALVATVALASAFVLARRPQWARGALACCAVMAAFFGTTVVHFGRHLYSRDPLYPVARAWSFTQSAVEFPCEDQGAWTVAAADINARLEDCGHGRTLAHARATWSNEPLRSNAAWTLGPPRRSFVSITDRATGAPGCWQFLPERFAPTDRAPCSCPAGGRCCQKAPSCRGSVTRTGGPSVLRRPASQ